MSKTIIINYKALLVGGVQNYIFDVVNRYIELGYRVIWIRRKKLIISDIYKEIMINKVENYKLSALQLHLFKNIPLNLSSEDEVVILSFKCQDHARALKIKKSNPDINIRTLYLIPHFTESEIFPEQDFSILKASVNRRMAEIYKKWIDAGNILFFNAKHIQALEKAYGLTIKDKVELMVPYMSKVAPFEYKEAILRYDLNNFKIVAASRFEFPHKGFMIGLIREFTKIKELCPGASLYLIGEGNGKSLIDEEICKLNRNIAQDIHVLGMMSEEKLINFYKTCQLSISVAGCASLSASLGVITLPARHYTYNCEVYGFLPESKECFLETKPGNPVLPYIKKILNTSREEYVEYSKIAYDTILNRIKPIDTKKFFVMKNYDINYNISNADLIFIKWISIIGKILSRIKKNAK